MENTKLTSKEISEKFEQEYKVARQEEIKSCEKEIEEVLKKYEIKLSAKFEVTEFSQVPGVQIMLIDIRTLQR